MATSSTETSERDDTERSTTTGNRESSGQGRSLPGRALEQVRNGRVPMLAGGILAVRGLRGLLSERGGGLGQTAAGLALLGFGLRQRSSSGSEMIDIELPIGEDDRTDEDVPGTETVAMRAESNEPGHNPRDVDEEPDVETAAPPDEGAVQYETDRDDVDVERKPHLDEVDPKDPRYPDEGDPETDDEHVDVDVSEAALADEPNEAVGPDEEQAYPSIEGTDPEPSGAGAPERSMNQGPDQDDEETEPGETTTAREPSDEESDSAGDADTGGSDADADTGNSDVDAEAMDSDADEDEE